MVQPYNYQMAGIQSPFESVVQGLRLGATLETLQAQREQQRQAAMLAQQQAEQQRAAAARRAELMSEYARGTITQAGIAELAMSAGSEANARGLWAASDQMGADRRNAMIGQSSQLSVAMALNPAVAMQMLEQRQSAEPNNPTWGKLKAMLSQDNMLAAKYLATGMLGMGQEGQKAFEQVAEKAGFATKESFRVLTPDQVKAEGLPTGNTYQRNTATGKTELLTTAGKSFEVVSRAEAEKLGLQEGAYKREIGTGEISAIGPGGMNIMFKTEGAIPEGYRAIRDAQGNLMSYEPVSGSPAAAKAQAEAAAKQARAEGKTQHAGIVSQDIQRLVAALDSEESLSGAARLDPRNYVTGIPGKAAEKLPGSARIAAQGFVDSIKASIGFDRLDQMRQESSTGGALGNITEQELRFLQATLGSIDLDSKPEVLRQNLRRLQTIYENIMRKAAEYPNAAKFGFSAAAQGQVGGTTVQPAPGGAVMEPVLRTPAAVVPPVRTPSPARAAPPARGGTSLGDGFYLRD